MNKMMKEPIKPTNYKHATINEKGHVTSPSCCDIPMVDVGGCSSGCCDYYKCSKCSFEVTVEWSD